MLSAMAESLNLQCQIIKELFWRGQNETAAKCSKYKERNPIQTFLSFLIVAQIWYYDDEKEAAIMSAVSWEEYGSSAHTNANPGGSCFHGQIQEII